MHTETNLKDKMEHPRFVGQCKNSAVGKYDATMAQNFLKCVIITISIKADPGCSEITQQDVSKMSYVVYYIQRTETENLKRCWEFEVNQQKTREKRPWTSPHKSDREEDMKVEYFKC